MRVAEHPSADGCEVPRAGSSLATPIALAAALSSVIAILAVSVSMAAARPAPGAMALAGAGRPLIVVRPPAGSVYHGVFPGSMTDPGSEWSIEASDVTSYETSVGHSVAWVYFSDEWSKTRRFPLRLARMARRLGAVPFVRLMLTSTTDHAARERNFTLDRIIRGSFDRDLAQWGRSARQFGSPLMVEYGTEVNGEWFPWNGKYNGAGRKDGFRSPRLADGPERFREAFRHIVTTVRKQGAGNITWVFHANWESVPSDSWNRIGAYYPGDAYVDWIAVSAYGAQDPRQTTGIRSFRRMMDAAYPKLGALSRARPIIVAEFGTDVRNPIAPAAPWAQAALDDLIGHRWRRVAGFSWWNERWQNDDDPAHDTTMRVQQSQALASVIRHAIGANGAVVVCRPRLRRR